MTISLLEFVAYTIGLIHFATPLCYYSYLRRFRNKPWALKIDYNFKPKIAVILPTYNESEVIEKRLDNLRQQDYPGELIKLIVVDSSNDNTADLVEKSVRGDYSLELIREEKRAGKLEATLVALRQVSADVGAVVFTDADVVCEHDALTRAIAYLSDPSVGCVTSSMAYLDTREGQLQHTYRDYSNIVRLCESKIHSTPIHNGQFMAIRSEPLRRVGLPTFTGCDDSMFGSLLGLAGYRAIQVDDIVVMESTRSQFKRMIRRAQTLLFNFLLTKRYAKNIGIYRTSRFDKVWKAEWWLHIVNPWFLVTSAILVAIDIAFGSTLSLGIFIIILASLFSSTMRAWFLQQAYLIIAAVRSVFVRKVVWEKRSKA